MNDMTQPEADAHAEGVYRANANEIRQFVEAEERRISDRQDLSELSKEGFAEMKSRGYDTKVLRKVIARRKREADDLAEEEAVLEMYEQALEGN